jgi:hypothetical protein
MSIRMAAACLVFSGLSMAVFGDDSPRSVEARLVVAVADHMNHHPQALLREDLPETPSLQGPASFVKAQPASTVAQAPVKDHQSIARALRERAGTKAPGNRSENPWSALSNLTSGGSRNGDRREVLMIASGMGCTGDAACANAEEWPDVDAGVVQLAHVCYETGGEAYFISHGAMKAITPFLDDIAEHLANQYLITVLFNAAPRVWVGEPEC